MGGKSETSNPCDGSEKSIPEIRNRGSSFVAPVQRNDFGIVEFSRSQEYTRKMVVWLTLTRVGEAKQSKHHSSVSDSFIMEMKNGRYFLVAILK